MEKDDLEIWKAREEWAKAVRSKTKLDPDRLQDPTAWHLQYRHSMYWAIMGPYLAVVAFWIVAPFVRPWSGGGPADRGTIDSLRSAPP